MTKIWKDVKGYEGSYQVSSDGEVRSVAKSVRRNNGRKHTIKSTLLRPALNKDGYYKCALCVDKKLKSFRVHRLVAEAFLVNTCNGEVNHKDGNKRNNAVTNLEYVSHQDNCKHARRLGLQVSLKGSKIWNAKLHEIEIPLIRGFLNAGISARALARLYGMDKSVFNGIKNNTLWKHA